MTFKNKTLYSHLIFWQNPNNCSKYPEIKMHAAFCMHLFHVFLPPEVHKYLPTGMVTVPFL